MKRSDAWKQTVRALRLHYLQGNSHIDGIDERIDEWIVETLDQIRKTGKSRDTAKLVSEVDGRGNPDAPRCLAH